MFPHGVPGLGLALLRLALALDLLLHRLGLLPGSAAQPTQIALATVALGLLLGLFTPWFSIACCGVAVIELASLDLAAGIASSLVFGFSAAALGLLGPGAYSVDARLFGRRVLKPYDHRD